VVLQGMAGSATGNRHTAVRGRIENQVTPGYVDLYIEERMLRAHCAAINRGYTEFVTELEAKAVAKIGVVKNLLSGTGGPTMRVKCLKITRPAADVSEFD
jgi:hypothetical protein